ncbi:restriction endonuclease subunit S [Ligilactobacillus salivarius]|uniref:restriction endonuclease subunit S n=1 Tax=Ligilactobacillus salivarius TaxID=1624 RepID=UPI002963DAA8|nr:restriction endonuclease subunit S [Ligilactobacillus salivarius]WOX36796.1 restriction endonuclease subunit S [Ligilactobacillus salivarius]
MDNKKNGIPKLRFPGFTGAWEQRKLGEIGKVFTGNTPSTKNTENWTTDKSIGHVWITPTDINNNIMFDSERYLSDKGWSQARVVPKNSVLITSIASIGKNAINGVEVAFNQQINALVVQKNNPYFILTLMNKEKQRFESLAGQTATPIINKSTFSSFMVKIPSETEQKHIGYFFNQLDSLIALHQRKLEHLQEQKKGLLQKMFPKNGETVPEVRFPGFTDAWEQRKFNRIFIKNIEKNKGQYTFDKTISIATMHFKKEGNGASKSSLAGYKVLRVGDIAFEGHTSKKFKYGRFVMNDIGDGIMSPRFSALRPVEEISVSFWKQYIHYEPIMRKILVRSTKSGTMMNELVINDLYKESILVPSTEEQKKIGAFFNQLDSLITLHQRKLEHLELMKKGLLQQMFV